MKFIIFLHWDAGPSIVVSLIETYQKQLDRRVRYDPEKRSDPTSLESDLTLKSSNFERTLVFGMP